MNSATLDRSRPDQRHLNDQVFDAGNLDAQQHLDLGPALDLDDSQHVATLDHLVDTLVRQVNVLRLDNATVAFLNVAQTPVKLVEARIAQEVELDEAGVRHGVFVPLADVAPVHGRASI